MIYFDNLEGVLLCIPSTMPARRPNLTHFLCIPLVSSVSRPQLQLSLRHLADNVAAAPGTGPSPQDIKYVGSLHLTLGVMSLETKERIETACTLLQSLDLVNIIREAATSQTTEANKSDQPRETARSTVPSDQDTHSSEQTVGPQDPRICISLRDLCAMHAPESTSILYARPVDPTNRLFSVCHAIQQTFSAANLLERQKEPLLLHATIVNVRSGRTGRRTRRSKRVDARNLVAAYQGFDWAKDFHLEKVSICRMRADKIMENDKMVDAVYAEVDHILLPGKLT